MFYPNLNRGIILTKEMRAMATDMRVKPIVSGKDAEKFLERVKRNNERLEKIRAKRLEMQTKRIANEQKENFLVKN